MFKLLLFISFVGAGLAHSINRLPKLNRLTPSGRIIDGVPVDIKEVPHQVSLQAFGSLVCGGIIIAKDWVLTAGHCAVYGSAILVRAGTTTKGSGGTLHPVTMVITHEYFGTSSYGTLINDIALLKLEIPIDFDESHQPIDLFNFQEEATAGVYSTVTGWGATSEDGTTSVILQSVQVPIISKVECHEAYKSLGGLPDGQICTSYPKGGKGICKGDSGGALTIDGRVAGIVSWSVGCAQPEIPGVYTEVASYRDWIDATIAMHAQ